LAVLGFAGGVAPARADVLVTGLADETPAVARLTHPNRHLALTVTRPHQDTLDQDEEEEPNNPSSVSAVGAFALSMFILPFGSRPKAKTPTLPPQPVVKPPFLTSQGGFPHVSWAPGPYSLPPTNHAPEPTSLVLALAGSGLAAFRMLARRRKTLHDEPAAGNVEFAG
jgi:hypothetical protein